MLRIGCVILLWDPLCIPYSYIISTAKSHRRKSIIFENHIALIVMLLMQCLSSVRSMSFYNIK